MHSTMIGWPSSPYTERPEGRKLGSGIAFVDEATCTREFAHNAARIEAWRRTESYTLYQIVRLRGVLPIRKELTGRVEHNQDFRKMLATDPIQGFDVAHQLWRLRHAKRISDGEAEVVMRTIASNLQTYDQVTQVSLVASTQKRRHRTHLTPTQLLAYMPPHANGLLPLSFGLFHQSEIVRELTIDIFNELRSYPVGFALSGLLFRMLN